MELGSRRKLDSHLRGPGEIKRREVELGFRRKLDSHLRGPGEFKRREVELDPQDSPGEIKSKAVELGCHREWDHPLLHLFLNSCFSDIVFVALLRTALETAISEVRKLLNSHWRGPYLLNIVVLVAADGLFGLCGSERLGRAIHRYPPPLPVLV